MANKMADFTLVVGVDPVLSTELVKDGIKQVIEEISDKPFDIKIKIDQISLNTLSSDVNTAVREGIRRATQTLFVQDRAFTNGMKISSEEMEPIVRSLSNITEQLSSVFKDGGPLSDLTKSYQNHAEAVRAAVEAEKAKELQSDSTSSALLKEAVSLKEGADAATKEAIALGEVAAVAKKIDSETFAKVSKDLGFNGFNAEQIKMVENDLSSMAGKIENIQVITEKFGEASDQVVSLHINRIDEAGQKFQTYIRYVKDAEGEWQRLNNRDSKKWLAPDAVQANQIKELIRAYAEYESKWTQISKQQSNMEKFTGFDKQISYTKLSEFIERLNELYSSFASNKITFEQFQNELRVIDGQFQNNQRSVLKFISDQKAADEATKKNATALRESTSALDEYQSKWTQIYKQQVGMKKYTGITDEGSYKSLQQYIERLNELFGSYTIGEKTYGQFRAEMKRLDSDYQQSQRELLKFATAQKEADAAKQKDAKRAKELASAYKDYETRIERINTLRENASKYNGFEIDKSYAGTQDYINRLGAAMGTYLSTDDFGAFKTTMTELDADFKLLNGDVDRFITAQKESEGEISKANSVLRDYDTTISRITTLMNQLYTAGGEKSQLYDRLTQMLSRLESAKIGIDTTNSDEIDNLAKELELVSTYLDSATRSVKDFTNEQKEQERQANATTNAQKLYLSMLNSVKTQMRSMTLIGGDDAKETEEYADLEGFKTRLEELWPTFKKLNDGVIDPAGIRNFIAALKELGIEIETNRGKVSAYISTEKLHQRNLNNYTTTVEKLETALKKNSAAKHSNNKESAEAYRTIESTLTGLKEQKELLDKGRIGEGQFGREVDNASNTLKEQLGVLKANGSAFMSWSDQFKNISHTLASWVSPVRILMQVVRQIKQMISASIELNDAMTQMQIVTRASDGQMAKFGETAAAAAKRIGSSITDFVSSATTYARLGYDTEQSSMFAEYTAMLQNVGDIEVDDAQNAITAIVKAFNIAPDELKQKMDEMVTIGNGFPISVAQIAEGMNNASSTLAAAGNDFEQSVALLTAANTTVQNAAKAATGLRTITARLRNTKTDLEELGEDMTESKYEDLVKALTGVGVALTDVNNDYRSTYDIMKDIADAWDDMTGEQKSALVTQLAGTRQQDIFYSIINQFRDAERAYGEMVNNSTGALDRAYSTYMESASAHINQFKAAFQELSGNFIDSKIIADVADFGRKLLNAANGAVKLTNSIGGLKTVLVALAGIIATINIDAWKTSLSTGVGFLPKIITGLKSVILFLPRVVKAIGVTAEAMLFTKAAGQESAGAMNTFSMALKGVGISASAAQAAVFGIFAVVTLLVSLYNKWKQAEEERIAKAKESANSAAQETEEITNLIAKYNELRKAVDDGTESREELIKTKDQLFDSLDLEKSKLEELIKKYGDYTTAIRGAAAEKLREDERLLRGGISAAGESLGVAAQKTALISGSFGYGTADEDREAISLLRKGWFDSNKYLSIMAGTGTFNITNQELDTTDPESVIRWYEQLGDMLDVLYEKGLDNTSVYKSLQNAYSNISTQVNEYRSAVSNLNTNLAEQETLDKELPKTQAEFELMREEMVSAMVSAAKKSEIFIGSEEDIERAIDGVLKKEPELTEFYNNFADTEKRAIERSGRIKGIWENLIPKGEDQRDWKRYINSLNDEEIEIAYKIVKADGYLSIDELTEKIEEARPKGIEALKNAISKAGIEEFLDVNEEMLTQLSEQYGVTVDEIIQLLDRLQTESAVSVYGSVEALDKGFKKLGEIYDDVKDGGVFDYSKLIDDKDFEEEFGKVGGAYNEFIKTVAESPTDIAKCQDAFNELAKQYIITKGALNEVTEAQRDGTIAMLEQMGVANAAEVVDAAIAVDKKTLAQRMAELSSSSDDATKSMFNEANALYASGEAASVVQNSVYNLLLEKIQLNKTNINTSSDIANIIALANSCGAATDQMAALLAAMQTIAHYESLGAPKGFDRESAKQIWEAKNTIKNILSTEKLNLTDYLPQVQWNGYQGTTSGKSGSGNSGGGTKEEDPFIALYNKHKHAVEMEKETLEKFYAWLDGADGYKKYYKEGTENFWKYEEEVKKGYRDLFKDIMSDMEHEISMREMFEGEFKTIDDMYVEMIKMVEDRIAQARHDGLSDESDYMQELHNLLQKYANDRAKLREDAQKAAADSVDALVEIRVKMLKQDIKNERDALKKRLDELKKFYDKQKEMLHDANDEEKYLEEQAEKRKKVFDLESQLRQLDLDDSAWAQKKKLELEQELADARKELDDFERDHALEMAEDQLDKQYEAREAAINKYDELLEEQEDDEITLYAKALADVRSGSVDLYNEMLEWNKKYGDGINDTITNAWKTAYKALNDYKDLFGSFFKDVKLANVAMQDSGFSWDTMQASDAGAKGGDSFVDYSMEKGNGGFIPGDIDGDGKVSTADARRAVRAAVGLEKLSDKETKRGDLDGDGKISTSDARKILRLAIGLDKQGYASGTSNATPGIHRIDEHGDETIFSSKDGNKYKLFSGGEKVLNAKASNFLYNFANSGGDMIKRAIWNAVSSKLNSLFGRGGTGIDIRTGDIIINGNADKATVSEMRRAQREQVETILKSFNRLKA